MIPIRRTPSPCSVRTEPRLSPCRGSAPQRRRFGERYQGCQNRAQSEESDAPQSKPESDYDLRIYEKDLDRCPSDELYRRHESCRQEERASHGKGDQEGASNWRRKAEICRGAIVRRRAKVDDRKRIE